MRYKMEISFSETTNKLEVDCPNVGSIAETVLNDDKINDQLYDIYGDEISNAMDAYEKEPLGYCDEYYIHKLVYDAAYKYCDQLILAVRFDVKSEGKSIVTPQLKEQINRALKEKFYYFIERREVSEQSCIDEGSAFLACLNCFLSSGKWQFGLEKTDETVLPVEQWPEPVIEGRNIWWKDNNEILKPKVWFGLEGTKPSDFWVIYGTINDLENKSLNEFFDDDDMIFNNLGFSYAHYVWMFVEGGCDSPNISKIMKRCPIDFSDEDEPEVTLQRINKFFLEQYKKYRYGNKK